VTTALREFLHAIIFYQRFRAGGTMHIDGFSTQYGEGHWRRSGSEFLPVPPASTSKMKSSLDAAPEANKQRTNN
jgi:hypothetical protein